MIDVCRALRKAPEPLKRLAGFYALQAYIDYLVARGLYREAARALRVLGSRLGVPRDVVEREARRLEDYAALIEAARLVEAAAGYIRETGRLPQSLRDELEKALRVAESIAGRGGDVGEHARRVAEAIRDILVYDELARLQGRARRAADEATRLFNEAMRLLQDAYQAALNGDLARLATMLSLARSLAGRAAEAERLLVEAVREAGLAAEACGTGRCREATEKVKGVLDELRRLVHAERVTVEKLSELVLGELYPAMARARLLLHELPRLTAPVAAERLASVVRSLYAAVDHLKALAAELPGLYPERVRPSVERMLRSLAESVEKAVDTVVGALGEAAAASDTLWHAYINAVSASGRPTPPRPGARSLEEQVERVLTKLRDFADVFYVIGVSMGNFREGMRALMAASTGYYLKSLAELLLYTPQALLQLASLTATHLRRAAAEAARLRLGEALREIIAVPIAAAYGMFAPALEARNPVEALAYLAALATAMSLPVEEVAARALRGVVKRIPVPEGVVRAIEEAKLAEYIEALREKPLAPRAVVKLDLYIKTYLVDPLRVVKERVARAIEERVKGVERILEEAEVSGEPLAYIVKLEKLEPKIVITAAGAGKELEEAFRAVVERLKRELPPELVTALFAKLAKQMEEMARETRVTSLSALTRRLFKTIDEFFVKAGAKVISERLDELLKELALTREEALRILSALGYKELKPREALRVAEEIAASYRRLKAAVERLTRLLEELAPYLPSGVKDRLVRLLWRYFEEGELHKALKIVDELERVKNDVDKLRALAAKALEGNPRALAELAEARTPGEIMAIVLRYALSDPTIARRLALLARDVARVAEDLRRALLELAAYTGLEVSVFESISPYHAGAKMEELPVHPTALAKYMPYEYVKLLMETAKRLGYERLTLQAVADALGELVKEAVSTMEPGKVAAVLRISRGLQRYLADVARQLGKLREVVGEAKVPELATSLGGALEAVYRLEKMAEDYMQAVISYGARLYRDIDRFLEGVEKVLRRYGLEREAELIARLRNATLLSVRALREGRVEKGFVPPHEILGKAAEVLRRAAERLGKRDIEKLIAELERLMREEPLASVAASILSELVDMLGGKYGFIRIETGTVLDKVFAATTERAAEVIKRLYSQKRGYTTLLFEHIARRLAREYREAGAEEVARVLERFRMIGSVKVAREVELLPGETRIVYHASITADGRSYWARYVLGFKLVEEDGRKVVRWYRVLQVDPELEKRPALRAVALEALREAIEDDELARYGDEIVILAERPVTWRGLLLSEVLPRLRAEAVKALREAAAEAARLPPGAGWALLLPPEAIIGAGIKRRVEVSPGRVVLVYERAGEQAVVRIEPDRVVIEGSLPLLIEALRFDVAVREALGRTIRWPGKKPELVLRARPGARIPVKPSEILPFIFTPEFRVRNVERTAAGTLIVTISTPSGEYRFEVPTPVIHVEYTAAERPPRPSVMLPGLPGAPLAVAAAGGVYGRAQREKLIL